MFLEIYVASYSSSIGIPHPKFSAAKVLIFV